MGVLLGGLLQFSFQFIFLLKKGYGPLRPRPFSRSALSVVKNLGIGAVGAAATQINVLVSTILATGAGIGAISWMLYAFRLFQLPIGIFGVSTANSHGVYFSDRWKAGDRVQAREMLSSGYALTLAAMLPTTAFLFTTALPFVKLIFERGAFDETDTLMTANALKAYALGLPFYGAYKLFTPVFFAIERPRIPVFISVFCIFANIVFCFLLVPLYGYLVLPLGTSLSMALNASLQAVFLVRYLEIRWVFFLGGRTMKLLASAGLALFVFRYLSIHVIVQEASFFPLLGQFLLTGAAGSAVYGTALAWVGLRGKK